MLADLIAFRPHDAADAVRAGDGSGLWAFIEEHPPNLGVATPRPLTAGSSTDQRLSQLVVRFGFAATAGHEAGKTSMPYFARSVSAWPMAIRAWVCANSTAPALR
jgi:hypothetical protein